AAGSERDANVSRGRGPGGRNRAARSRVMTVPDAAPEAPPVFDEVVGQDSAVSVLARAAADAHTIRSGAEGSSMTHAWLLTGPPGSGRSIAARAFAAALQCPTGGCGNCDDCHTVRAGTHPDVTVVAPE